jgi:hypothetical protein
VEDGPFEVETTGPIAGVGADRIGVLASVVTLRGIPSTRLSSCSGDGQTRRRSDRRVVLCRDVAQAPARKCCPQELAERESKCKPTS